MVGGWMHPFFLFLPTFLIGAISYVLFAGLWGAGRPVSDDRRREVDAVETRIAELADESDGANLSVTTASISAERSSPAVSRRRVPIFGLLAAVMLAILAIGAVCAPQRFKKAAIVYSAVYFAFAAAAAVQRKKR